MQSSTVMLTGGDRAAPGQWSAFAACRDVPEFRELIDRDARRRTHHKPSKRHAELVELCRAVCDRCPVEDACRLHGLMENEPYGMWGGLSAQDRADLGARVQRPRRRPRGVT